MARTVLVGALVCLALTLAQAAGAQSPRPEHASTREYPLNVDEQPLTRALEQLYGQTKVFYGYSPDSTAEEQIVVGPLKGKFTIEEALTKLLRKTDLTFTWINSKQISIVRKPPAPKVAVPPQVKTLRKSRDEKTAAPREEPKPDKTIEEVTSWASSIQPSSVGAPVQVLDPKYIARSGASSIADLLKYLSQQPFLRPDAFLSNGAQYVELRGLGADTTMVLINGRRAFASAASFVSNAFDVNQLPLSAVEQVEVRLDSISVRHGADAIGGILNVMLRNDIARPTVQVSYGSADGGGELRQAAISDGYKIDGFSAAVTLDHKDVSPLLGAKRELWSNQNYQRFGSVDRRTTLSSPGNVRALLPGNLPGLNAPFAAIPDHVEGSITQVNEFRAGETNYTSLFQYVPIVAEDSRTSVVATAQARVASDVFAAADLMVVDRHVVFQTTPPLFAALVPATNPYNDFHQPVMVSTLLEGIDPTQASTDAMLMRGSLSLRGKARAWDWELSLLRSEEDAEFRIDNVLDSQRINQVLADPDRGRTINLLRPGPAAGPELLATLLLPPDINTFAIDGTHLSGFVRGRLFAMPAGDVSTLLGSEWRKEVVQFDSLLGAFEREAAAGFAELKLPLFGQAVSLPGVRELSVTLAGRFDRYTDFGEIFNPQYVLLWKPLRDVAFRTTYGRSFRPPSLFDLYQPATPIETQLLDLRRSRELARVSVIGGGNRELAPTRGESFSAGLEFSPGAVEQLKLSATYWRVTMDDRVTALPLEFALTHEEQIAGRVLRAEPTADDLARGLPGKLLQLDLSRMNFGRLTTSGIDVGARYEFNNKAGRFVVDTKATWIDEYKTLDLPGMPAADRVNIANSLGTIAKWRAIVSIDWQRGALGASAHARYVPAYSDTLSGVRNGRTLPSQTFIDLQLALDLDEVTDGSLLRGFELAAGAWNLFDEQPHFAEVGGIQGYDNSQGDLKGRFWYLRLGKTF